MIRKKINAKIGAATIRKDVLHGILNENTDELMEMDWGRMNLAAYGTIYS